MPDVPVPDTANANDPSGARNSRASRARTSSSSAHHERIEMAERRRRHRAHHARRGQARTGAEQDAIGVGQQAHAGTSSKCASASRSAAMRGFGSGSERRPRHADVAAERGSSAAFKPGDAVGRAEQPRQRHELRAAARAPRRGGRSRVSSNSRTQASGSDARRARGCRRPRRRTAPRRTSTPMPASTLKSSRRRRHEIGDLRDVAARFLHADDVRVRRQPRDRGRQQVDAGDRGEVVEQHRHRRRVGDRGVVTDEHVGGHLRLEEPRRAHQHGVGAELRGAPGRARSSPASTRGRCRR